MCGIAGVLHTKGDRVDLRVIESMCAQLSHRGPDFGAVWHNGSIALGHRRLSIRELSPAGNQPFIHEKSKTCVVFNGEIYNDTDIARELERLTGFVRKSKSDTEIIPAAYEVWGLEAFNKFEGIFAIALWDEVQQKLILARDGIGTKPLYIAEHNETIIFASEIKAILAYPGLNKDISSTELAHMLALGYTSPFGSLLKSIRQLSPGTLFVFSAEKVYEKRFWLPNRLVSSEYSNNFETVFLDTFSKVVDDQLASDVPVCIMQSGGVDSSLITMVAPKNRDIPLYSVRFPGTDHDESRLAEQVAKASKRELRWVELESGADVVDDFKAVVRAVDGQLADSSALATFALSRAVSRHIKVALSGDGSDEFFGGYPTYQATRIATHLSKLLPACFWKRISSIARKQVKSSNKRISNSEKAFRFLSGLPHRVPHAVWRHYLHASQRESIYGKMMLHELSNDPFSKYAEIFLHTDGNIIDKALVADQRYYLPGDMLVKVDRTSMAHGLEVRVPFLDRRVMELAGKIDSSNFFTSRGQCKSILRKALAKTGLPNEIVSGKKKGFCVPVSLLLSGPLYERCRYFLFTNPDIFSPYLNPDGIRQLWKEHFIQNIDCKYTIWTLLTIGTWLEAENIY
ncbi:asparagine synthase (glutamine-hydrolyzing) [Desulfovibrio mangrovi]|uniref:asparagine synthase (glutamine-hydrolyzing) n=1 Tax=Desulfovibrio mangrovi TaxID=2976983 RepID=UPI0022469DBA|nr:asparagine synthase (glutamine-hydrolyzing) [Desulfovibrio mangrovi]UZP65856.1 asparagine synthase (glutamine-hydrolyzing) [Desulfovibrio mangrovi]